MTTRSKRCNVCNNLRTVTRVVKYDVYVGSFAGTDLTPIGRGARTERVPCPKCRNGAPPIFPMQHAPGVN